MLLFSHQIISDSLWPHGLEHARLPCPSLSSGICSDSCPLSWWCHPTISSSVIPFSSCPQSFSASGSFPMIWLFESGGQSIGGAASASVLPMNIQGWFPIGLTGWISLQSKGLSRVFFSTTVVLCRWWSSSEVYTRIVDVYKMLMMVLAILSVCLKGHSNIPQTECLKQRKLIFSQLWTIEGAKKFIFWCGLSCWPPHCVLMWP